MDALRILTSSATNLLLTFSPMPRSVDRTITAPTFRGTPADSSADAIAASRPSVDGFGDGGGDIRVTTLTVTSCPKSTECVLPEPLSADFHSHSLQFAEYLEVISPYYTDICPNRSISEDGDSFEKSQKHPISLSRTVAPQCAQKPTVPDSARTVGTVAPETLKTPVNKRNTTVPTLGGSNAATVPEGICTRPRRSIAGTGARTPDRTTQTEPQTMTTKPLFTTPATMARAKTPPTPRTRKTPRNTWAETTTTGTCPTCNQPTINTLENSAVRIHNTADPTTLTSPQELDTLKTGRHTYQLNTRTNTMERRTIHHIRSNPPEHDKYPTLPQHACGQIMGTPITPNQQKEKTVNENPPF